MSTEAAMNERKGIVQLKTLKRGIARTKSFNNLKL